MANWIDIGVITIVIIAALAIFYKALKEPIDTIMAIIKKAMGSARDKVVEGTSGGETTVIRYG